MAQHALDTLSTSKVKEIYLIGRRGPLQAAFTIKELREMLKLTNCQTTWKPSDFTGIKDLVPQLPRPRKRLTELMLKSLNEQSSGTNKFKPVFFHSPLEFLGADKVEKVKLCINYLQGAEPLKQRAVHTDKTEYLDCGLAITSIGFKSVQVDPDIPFDFKKGVAKNVNGKISDGIYATGWLATGPTGVILATMTNAFRLAEYMATHLKQELLENKPGFGSIEGLLKKKGVQIVYWKDWLKIDAYEKEEGKKLGKPREKIVCIKKMLEVAQ